MNEDAVLLRRYAEEKSEAAFTELVRRHVDLVYSAALRRLGGDAHTAADVAQQVFTTLARDAQKLARHTVLTAWLYTATRNAAVDLIRSEQRRATREQEATAMQNLFAAAPDADWERLRPVLDSVMDELSDADRTAVLLRFFEKRAFADIGVTLRLSEDAARMRVERALEKLRALLARRGVTSTAVALATGLANQAVATAPLGLAASIAGAALGGAASVGTGLGVTLRGIMSTTKLNVVAALMAAAVVATATVQVNKSHDAAVALAGTRQEHAALSWRLTSLEAQRSVAEQEKIRLVKARDQLRAAPSVATNAPPRSASAEQDRINAVADQLKQTDPQLQLVRKQRVAMDVREEFQPLFREFGWTFEQIDRFAGLVGEQRLRGPYQPDIGVRAQNALPPTMSEEQVVEVILGQFGDAAAKRYVELRDTIGARFLVNQLGAAYYYADAPLTAAQADRLAVIIKEASPTELRKVEIINRESITDWDRVVAQAESLLSPAQLDCLRSFAAGRRADELYQRLRRGAVATANISNK